MTPTTVPTLSSQDASTLGALLWRERELLENLLFRVVEQQRLLTAGDVRWLPRLDADVEHAARAVQDHEVLRAIEVDDLARRGGFDADVALNVLAHAFPQPWPDLVREHAATLRSLVLEIDAVTSENRRLLRVGEQATREALDQTLGASSTPAEPTFGPARRPAAVAPHLLDTRA